MKFSADFHLFLGHSWYLCIYISLNVFSKTVCFKCSLCYYQVGTQFALALGPNLHPGQYWPISDGGLVAWSISSWHPSSMWMYIMRDHYAAIIMPLNVTYIYKMVSSLQWIILTICLVFFMLDECTSSWHNWYGSWTCSLPEQKLLGKETRKDWYFYHSTFCSFSCFWF